MKTSRRRDLCAALTAFLCLSAVAVAQNIPAQTPAGQTPPGQPPAADPATTPAVEFPSAEEIFEAYVEAIGGRDAIRAQSFRALSGTYRGVPFSGGARISLWQHAPDKSHFRFAEPLGRRFDMVSNGETVWQQEGAQTATEISGASRVEMIESSDFYGESNYAERYAEMSVTGAGTVQDEEVWVVYVRSHEGRERSLMFSKETSLFVAERSALAGDTEQIVQVVLDQYEDVGGVLYPMRQRQQVLGTERRVEIVYKQVSVEEFEHDFDPPADMIAAPKPEPEAADETPAPEGG